MKISEVKDLHFWDDCVSISRNDYVNFSLQCQPDLTFWAYLVQVAAVPSPPLNGFNPDGQFNEEHQKGVLCWLKSVKTV